MVTRTIDVDKLRSRGLGLNRSQRSEYSVGKIVRALLEKGQSGISGLEREAHDELSADGDYPQKSEGCLIPFEIFDSPRRRDMSATTFGAGGAFIQTDVQSDVIPLLRNQSVVQRLGARVLTGLSGNVAMPRQTSAVTVSALAEQGQVAGSTPSLDHVLMTPHRISASITFTRQLALQSSVDIENFLREDLAAQLALKWDSQVLAGQGGAEPTGILNTTGVGSLVFGGTVSWQEIQNMENALASSNSLSVPGARVGFATTPSVRSRWKAIAKTGVGVTSVVPVFLVDDFIYPDDSQDTRCNGYRYASTNQILNNLVYFGNWADLVVGFFGRGIDIIVDPYTKASTGSIVITANAFLDVAVRHAQSFVVSQDAGNQ